MTPDPHAELERQIAALLDVGPGGAKLAAQLAMVRRQLERTAPPEGTGNIPICLAMREPPIAALMQRITVRGANGIVDMTPATPAEFRPLDTIVLPPGDVYVLVDVDTGRARLNMTPQDSLAAVRAEGRTPLTLEEGVMVAFLFPQIFTDKERYNCIQMPGSRRAGDQRVPSIWFSKGSPRLGWCWDRNPHTWLASASAARRIGVGP
jgi:hypothetical protein